MNGPPVVSLISFGLSQLCQWFVIGSLAYRVWLLEKAGRK